MRILVISDSHGRKREVEEVLYLHSAARDVIFLGDGLRDLEDLPYIFPDHRFYKVAGNCDLFSDEKLYQIIKLGGKQIFFTHGHAFGVKSGLERFEAMARGLGVDIALYGHTHIPYTKYADGMYIMNPGALTPSGDGKVCYGIIDITPGGIITIPAVL